MHTHTQINISKEMTDQEANKFIDLVEKYTSIKMHLGKKMLLINRINRRLKALSLNSFDEYYHLLTDPVKNKSEIGNFIDAVTTNETYFFRAPRIWKYFSDVFLPNWWSQNKNLKNPLNMWCAATSSGEEPYTISILCEEFAKKNRGFTWKMKASDISLEMLDKCKKATYKGRSISQVESHLLKEYFDGDPNDEVVVKKNITDNIFWFKHKLQDPPKYKNFDIVFLRNVMIYFDIPNKDIVLEHVYNSMVDKGTLIIGESEGLVNVNFKKYKYITPSIYIKD